MKISPKKIQNYYHYQKALQDFSEYSSEYPPQVDIETTAICNLKCNKCPVGRERIVKPGNSFMDMGLYEKIIDEIKDYSMGVTLSYFGEPLVNPRIFEYVSYAKKHRLSVTFYSNGILLDKTIAEQIIRHQVDNIAFSVDCLPDDYEYYAHLKNMSPVFAKEQIEKIIQNIIYLMDRINRSGVNTKISVVRMDSPEGTPVETYNNFFKGTGVFVGSTGIIDWGGTVDRVKVTMHVKKPIVCHLVWNLIIHSSGSVGMCCVDYNAAHKIGDANHETIKEIYNGEKIRNIRKMLVRHDYDGLPCKTCSFEDFGIRKMSPLLTTLKAIGNIYDKKGVLKHMYRSWQKLF